MRHSIVIAWLALVLVGLQVNVVWAQGSTVLEPGDAPVASLISVSAANESGNVTITGAANAVYPNAQVSIRNLYTDEIAYTQAGITGGFTASLFGPGNTPFLISPSPTIPNEQRNTPGSLPGGPATIVYGAFPERPIVDPIAVTQIVVDGELDDWRDGNYTESVLSPSVRGLRNQDSIYLAISLPQPEDYALLRVRLGVETAIFDILLDPRVYMTAVWEEVAGDVRRDLGTLGIAAEANEDIELRIPLAPLRSRLSLDTIDTVTLRALAFLDTDNNIISVETYNEATSIPVVQERSGIVYTHTPLGDSPVRFTVSGAVAQGAGRWHAQARLQRFALQAEDTLRMEIDVALEAPALGASLVGLQMIGRIGLQPVAVGSDLVPTSGGLHTQNGWSSVLTPSGIAVDNLVGDVMLGEVVVPPSNIIREDDTLVFGIPIDLPLPDDLPAGVYVPFFEGYAQVGDGERFRWSDNGLFGSGEGISQRPLTRFPVPLRIGLEPDQPVRLLWTLLQDVASDGNRGVLADEDVGQAALSNRVRFNAPTLIVPVSNGYSGDVQTYPIEPYLPALMSNAYASTTAPLLPLLFPTGRYSAVINRPDGVEDTYAGIPILQSQLGTDALDERLRFGEQSPIDMYRLSTLNPALSDYTFDAYGDYRVELTGFVEDRWGNRYEGGGAYQFVVAELFDMSPGVLPGTPFEVGDAVQLGLHITPNTEADVTITVRVFPLDGSEPIEEIFSGTANPYGVFQPDSAFVLSTAGEYVIDYEARYTDENGRLWAGSLRSAGVIATSNRNIVAHGQRGVANFEGDYDPIWFFVERYTDLTDGNAQVYQPYETGDVAWIVDSRRAGIQPQFVVQDESGAYAEWLQATYPDFQSVDGVPVERLIATDALPNPTLTNEIDTNPVLQPDAVVHRGYSYFSFVTPAVSLRQMVLGDERGGLPTTLLGNDPLSGQIGAGGSGLRPDDVFFMFGGMIIDNEQADISEVAVYASTGVVISEEAELGARVFPPYNGAAGGPDGGALLRVNDQPIGMFFHPTAARPGDVLQKGDVLSVAGQVAPTLASDVQVRVTTPSGVVREFSGRANTIGYFYDPDQDRAVDEIGVWTVEITVSHSGISSVGLVEPPLPTGGVLGTQQGRFNVYVVPEENPKLEWTQQNNPDGAISAGFPFNFAFNLPAEWSEVNGYVTATFPHLVVEDTKITIPGSSLGYQFNPTALNRTYPFYEGNDGRLDGEAASDPLNITFVITGLNGDGVFDILARQVTIRHDRLTTLD